MLYILKRNQFWGALRILAIRNINKQIAYEILQRSLGYYLGVQWDRGVHLIYGWPAPGRHHILWRYLSVD